MAESFNKEKSFEFLLKSASQKNPTKIKASETNLLAIHQKIQLHLKEEKPLTKFEIRKMLSMLKNLECPSPRAARIAQCAQKLLIKQYQLLRKQGLNSQLNRSPSADSLISFEDGSSTNNADDSNSSDQSTNVRYETVKNDNDNIFEYASGQIISSPHQGESNQQLFDIFTASNLFSTENIDVNMTPSYVDPMNNDDLAPQTTTDTPLSQGFYQPQDRVNSNFEMPKPFSVPTLLETKNNDCTYQGSNVLKLRLADVQFDSDTVSIPLELLTNLNFRISDEGCQDSADKYIQSPQQNVLHQNVFSISTTNEHSNNKEAFTVSSGLIEENLDHPTGSQNDCLKFYTETNNIDFSQNQYILGPQLNLHTNQSASLDENTIIETPNSQCATFLPGPGCSKNISCGTTTKSRNTLPPISSFSTYAETSLLNTEISTFGAGSSKLKGPVLKSSSKKVDVDVDSIRRRSEIFLSRHQSDIFNAKRKNVNNETNKNMQLNPDTNIVPRDDAMQICKSLISEEDDLEMTEIEIRFLEAAAKGDEFETDKLIFAQNINSKASDVISSNDKEPSFVFNLDTNTDDLIEGTPFAYNENKIFNDKTKTRYPEISKIQASPKDSKIISATPNIIIDETPCCSSSIFSKTDNNLNWTSQPIKVSKKHSSLFVPYTKSTQSKSFLELYKSNIQRKSPSQIFGSDKIRVNDKKSNICQAASNLIPEDKKATKSDDQPWILDMSRKSAENLPKNSVESKNRELIQSENILLVDGAFSKNNDQMDTALAEPKEETFEEINRKLEEKFTRKRNKYRDTWTEKPDPPSSLLNLDYKVNVNNFKLPRLKNEEMNEKLKMSSAKVDILKEAFTKMIDSQISAKTQEDYRLNLLKNAAANSGSDSSDEDEDRKKKRLLKECKAASKIETKNFLEDLSKMQDDVAKENETKKLTDEEEFDQLIELLRKVEDCSWLK